MTDPATLRALLLPYSEKAEILVARVQYQEPQVRALLRLTQADGAFNISSAAKMLQVQPRQLFAWLSEHGWIYRRAGSRNWLAYQTRLQQGLLVHKARVQRGRRRPVART
ncbi:phage antirepressor KilAC domain-containing protein [Stenotrophomonas sp. JAI102]|uniref:phage antirepressor KilAC domain-containing protein n=1 Tax=Stenotrophomonas sp. JAI102 TaxID=2723077 RepID=UPI001856F112|nr:phage antirepressor KilAC domain-containing protein [Stenotrophomonas sp. JAI102]NYF36320.1 phage antirepressor YoqD-like protein [Stenotrophomonas sp. JAI102]